MKALTILVLCFIFVWLDLFAYRIADAKTAGWWVIVPGGGFAALMLYGRKEIDRG